MMKRAVFALISLGSLALVCVGCSKDDGGEGSDDGGTGGFGATYTGGYGATPFGGSTGTIGGTGSGATGGSGIGNVTGSGAVTSTGGASYSVAGSCAACAGPAPIGDGTQPVIDTIDDGDTAIDEVDARKAYWFVYQDTTAGGEWTSGVAGGEPAAVEAYSGTGFVVGGIGFNTWGAGIGTNLATVSSTGCPYDASNYAGVRFYAKGTGPVRFSVKTAATTPCGGGGGGLCMAQCHAHMGVDITLTSEWTEYTFTWDQMTRANWGPTVEFDPKTLIGFQWQSPMAPTAFEIGIDELEFLPGSGGGAGGAGAGGAGTGGAGGAGIGGSAGTPETGGTASGGTAGAPATAGAAGSGT